jgi:hypothetical protein
MARVCLLLVAVLAVLLQPICARSADPSAEEIASWVGQLGSPKFTEREAASRRLAALDSVPMALEAATESAKPEIARRAKAAVKAIQDRDAERRLQKDLAPINSMGLDLFIEKMVNQPGYATDERWRHVKLLVDGLARRAGSFTYKDYTKTFPDGTKLPPPENGIGTVMRDSRLLEKGVPSNDNVISGCLVLSSNSVARSLVVNCSVLIIIGDYQGSAQICHSFVICTGKIGTIRLVDNSIVLAAGEFKGAPEANESLFQVKSMNDPPAGSGNFYFGLKSVPGNQHQQNVFPQTDAGPLNLVKFFDAARIGLRTKQVKGATLAESVAAESMFALSGLRTGDELLAINNDKWRDPEEFRTMLRRGLGQHETMTLRVGRGDRILQLTVKTELPEEKK